MKLVLSAQSSYLYCLLSVRRPAVRREQEHMARLFKAATDKCLTSEFAECNKHMGQLGDCKMDIK